VTTPASSEPTGSAAPNEATGSARRLGSAGRAVSRLLTLGTELALILVGLGFIFLAVDDELVYLGIWDALAVSYVGVGVITLRRSRLRPPSLAPDPPRRDRFRFNFAFAIVSSLIGFTVAIDIATSDNPDEYAILLNILGVIAMIMSWMLLQAGYARRYAAIYRTNGGLTFPDTDHPAPVEFLYFAVTIGSAFSVSDVLVTTSRMRWHVMVHSAVSFFYNAAVVAFALSLIAGR